MTILPANGMASSTGSSSKQKAERRSPGWFEFAELRIPRAVRPRSVGEATHRIGGARLSCPSYQNGQSNVIWRTRQARPSEKRTFIIFLRGELRFAPKESSRSAVLPINRTPTLPESGQRSTRRDVFWPYPSWMTFHPMSRARCRTLSM